MTQNFVILTSYNHKYFDPELSSIKLIELSQEHEVFAYRHDCARNMIFATVYHRWIVIHILIDYDSDQSTTKSSYPFGDLHFMKVLPFLQPQFSNDNNNNSNYTNKDGNE